ncbi:hypothetical protein E2C01_014438 [Portunus trituberculatus]|uniref:Uncharacterized protein n=1 Tax=Portunus trituberculatus TaxID=210409 RepID=A0A5B7DIU0_PORTR|nr:hypothetical protein [Portunus trituberculatus]
MEVRHYCLGMLDPASLAMCNEKDMGTKETSGHASSSESQSLTMLREKISCMVGGQTDVSRQGAFQQRQEQCMPHLKDSVISLESVLLPVNEPTSLIVLCI